LLSITGCLQRRLHNVAISDGRDGFTLSLWRSDEGMRQAVYHPGTHRTLIDEDKAGHLSDRTAFTRLRPIHSWGDWDGEVAWPHA